MRDSRPVATLHRSWVWLIIKSVPSLARKRTEIVHSFFSYVGYSTRAKNEWIGVKKKNKTLCVWFIGYGGGRRCEEGKGLDDEASDESQRIETAATVAAAAALASESGVSTWTGDVFSYLVNCSYEGQEDSRSYQRALCTCVFASFAVMESTHILVIRNIVCMSLDFLKYFVDMSHDITRSS